jgi:rubredoxin
MWRCSVCGYDYDEASEGAPSENFPEDGECTLCNAGKDEFEKIR